MGKRRFSGSTDARKKRSTFRSFRISGKNILALAATLLAALFLSSANASLVDRTVAMIGDDTVTYRLVERIYAIGMLSKGSKVPLFGEPLSEDEFLGARIYSLRIILVNDHLRRIALKSPVSKEQIEVRLSALKKMLGGEKEFARFKAFYEVDDREITDIIREKLAVDEFFEKSAAGVEKVLETEMLDYYQREKGNLFSDRPYEEIREHIAKHLQDERVSRRNEQWLEGQMKRRAVRLID